MARSIRRVVAWLDAGARVVEISLGCFAERHSHFGCRFRARGADAWRGNDHGLENGSLDVGGIGCFVFCDRSLSGRAGHRDGR